MGEFGIFQLNQSLPTSGNRISESLQDKAQQKQQIAQGGQNFMETLESVLMETNDALKAADKAATDFASGKARSHHDVLIAMEKADLSLRTVTAVRNKVVESYQEIMRMQV